MLEMTRSSSYPAYFSTRAALAALIVSPQVLAADYFVAPSGNDNNPGTESKPFKTMRKAGEAATSPGDTVYIRGGVYGGGWDAHLSPQASGTAAAPITFRAYPGELPILDGSDLEDNGSGVEPTEVSVSHVRFMGLVARNWPSSGFSNGWLDGEPNPDAETEPVIPSSDLQFIHCIADNNGINGFAFNTASNVRFERNISLHNGQRLPSWSSGFSLYAAKGTNVVDGNVAFENIDISDNRSDGSGFILDEDSSGARFVNNVAFRNGGSCIRLTLSGGGQLFNNTCIQNGQDSNVMFNDEIYVSDAQSASGAAASNNVIWPGKAAFGGQALMQTNNVIINDGSSFVSATGGLDFHLAASASQLIDQGSTTNAPSDDNGFDFKCIKQQSGLDRWWQYVIDYDYVESVGGVAGCFRPGARPAGGGVDVGAFESGAEVVGCSEATECDDGNACTQDSCSPGAQCTNLPIEGCCTTDADCADSDQCTMDVCDVEASLCSNQVDPECGENASGEWNFDAETGYVSVCNWGGFRWSAAGPEEPGVNDTISSIEQADDLCYTGVVAAHDGYNGYAMLGINISQESGESTEALNTTPDGDGLNVSITNVNNTPLRVQIQDVPDADGNSNSWCVEVTGSGGFFEWTDFNTACWSEDEGEAYAMQPINVIAVMVSGDNAEDREFDFCLNRISPSGTECIAAPDAPTDSTSDMMTDATDPGSDSDNMTPVQPVDTTDDTPTATPISPDPGAPMTCSTGLSACGTQCVDLSADGNHCGSCDNGCDTGSVCSLGACAVGCAAGQLQCGQGCVDASSSPLHCGGCNQACLAGQQCVGGMCTGESTGGSITDPGLAPPAVATPASDDASCGCKLVGRDSKPQSSLPGVAAAGLLLGVAALRRRRRHAA